MATDLSHLVPSLVPSSQAATNTVSDNSAAMTAPGSASESTRTETPGDPAASLKDAHEAGRTHLQNAASGGSETHSWDDVSGRRMPWSR